MYDIAESLHSACGVGTEETRTNPAHKVIDEQVSSLEKILLFGQKFLNHVNSSTNNEPEFLPTLHQIVRVYEAVYNGGQRILCADSTSGGKTFTATAIKGWLDKKNLDELGKGKTKALIVAPEQAIGEAWSAQNINQYLHMIGLVEQNVVTLDKSTTPEELSRADVILVNYGKLSLQTTTDSEKEDAESNKYLAQLLAIADQLDLVVVDECHNLKNPYSNRAGAFQKIIDRTKNKHAVLLSATPIPNRLQDAGFLLYMLDPVKYAHYASNPFDYTEDQYSIANAVRSGHWFSFTREELKVLHGLPELVAGVPDLGISGVVSFSLTAEQEERYLKEWSADAHLGEKLNKLSGIQLEAAIPRVVELVQRISKAQPNAHYVIFSQRKEGFSEAMKNALVTVLGDKVGVINGNVGLEERLDTAKSFRDQGITATVNTYATVSEAIILSTRTTPVYIIFAEPPLVPATRLQSEGRPYRTRQEQPVHVLELVSEASLSLQELMKKEKKLKKQEEQSIVLRGLLRRRLVTRDASGFRKKFFKNKHFEDSHWEKKHVLQRYRNISYRL